ncbi:tyrosine-type recombinase/integrase [Solilutibacter silvestris]|uniref:Phage integrase family protein n=1 Tax=Solilutibacter silvestris TaxID=1645665 RepID=A0A2K1PYF8_9GAMM|nr:tyrosine-type recombinase/integrase [Lysobacter silvestris]PNS07825.1 Phage integrase family protein [Lysobacter silvestris]
MPHELHKSGVRTSLAVRNEPYWGAPVERGLYVGFRRLEHGGNWVARYRVDFAKQQYKALGPATKSFDYDAAKKDAQAWKKAVDAGVKTGEVETVADACTCYVKALRKAKREKTARDAERRFERVIDNDALGKIRLDKLKKQHIEAWRERLEEGRLAPIPTKRGRPPVAKPLAPAGFKRMLTALKAALNHAVEEEYVSPDKAMQWRGVKPEKEADGRRDLYLSKPQRRALLDAAQGNVRDLIECVALTGCRPGDPAVALRKDYDASNKTVTFRTKDHARTIPLSPAAAALLDRLAKSKLPNAYLFTQDNGKPWASKEWAALTRAAATDAGLPDGVVLYTLRHCWITEAITGGMDVLTVARLAGTSLAMIQKHYGHLVSGTRDQLAAIAML